MVVVCSILVVDGGGFSICLSAGDNNVEGN
jgi:hypothetical protein